MIQQICCFILILISFLISNEIEIKPILLKGKITNPKEEISGLDWYKNDLILLPENLNGYVYIIPKKEIIQSLSTDNPNPILPLKNKFKTPNYSLLINGFEGFESIAFYDDKFIITIEAEEEKIMKSYMAWGKISPETLNMTITKDNLIEIKTPIQVKNMTYESALIYKNDVILFYEANGKNLQKSVFQPKISLINNSITYLKYPNIEYRITDVTSTDEKNRFWAINYFWPGDKKYLNPAKDKINENYDLNHNNKNSETIERLIEFEISKNKINLTNKKPIQLKLNDENSRNWEGIVRLDQKGFIIATDKYPQMILAFVEYK